MEFRSRVRTNDGYLALPPSGTGPGIVVLHAWWGLSEFFVDVCDRLAGEGYVALAPDLFSGAVASTIPEAEALRDAHNLAAAQAEAQVLESFDYLLRHPALRGERVGVIGFSLGGWWALQLSAMRPEHVAATVLFYGVGDADFTQARCAYQGHFAENDAFDSLDDARAMADAMRAAGSEMALYEYRGVGHWFFESNQPEAYDAPAAALAWDRTVAFLNGHLRSIPRG